MTPCKDAHRCHVILNKGDRAMSVDIEIDQFTPCLVERKSGRIVDTVFSLADEEELRDLQNKGWLFDRMHKELKNSQIYKLMTNDNPDVQGLVAIENCSENFAVHLSLAESAPHNIITQ